MKIFELIKHKIKICKLSHQYLGTYTRYMFHDIDKLFLPYYIHCDISQHHPHKYEYWYNTWKRNNWEEICLNWEAHGSAQQIMYTSYHWAYMYVKPILTAWGIWQDNNDEPVDNQDYDAFQTYLQHRPYKIKRN